MSSPKRYLWDTSPVLQPWRYQPKDYDELDLGPMIDRASRLLINGHGDVLTEVKAQRALYESLARRSQAGCAQRFRPSPDRVAIVVLHLHGRRDHRPGAVDDQQLPGAQGTEIHGFASPPQPSDSHLADGDARARAADHAQPRQRRGQPGLGPDGLGKRAAQHHPGPPETIVRWDEASCVQFVYLYTEIVKKLGRDVPAFFNLAGRKRPFASRTQRPQPGAGASRRSASPASTSAAGRPI